MGGILDHRGWARSNGGLWLPSVYDSPNQMGFVCCEIGCDPPGCWSFGVSGFSDDTCSDCEVFNRTWYLAYQGTVGTTSTWACTISEYCSDCGEQTVTLTISDTTISLSCNGVTWSKTITSAAEAQCTSHTLTYQSNSGGCTYDESDVTITPGYNAQGLCPCPTYCPGQACSEGQTFYAGTTPKYLPITVSGITNLNPDCTHCPDLDGTYIVPQGASACAWESVFAITPPCSNANCDHLEIKAGIAKFANPPYCTPGDIQVLVYFTLKCKTIDIRLAVYKQCIGPDDSPIDGTTMSITANLFGLGNGYCTFPPTITVG